jgi:hypothetical protein
MYLGDFKEDGDVFFKFTTRAFATGIPTVLANTPVLSVFIDENTTGKTTAETYFDLDVSLGSIVGYNNVRIDLSGDAFFATGGDYSVVITTGTVDSVSVVGEVVGTFSIENRSMGQPVGSTLSDDIAAIKSETALIVADTSETQGKLPTNKFMGSSDGADDDGNINSILAGTVTNAQGTDVATDVAAMIDVNNRVDVGAFLGTAVAAATASGEVNANVTELGGVVQSLTDLKDFADAGYDPGTNKITGCVLTDTVTTVTNQLSAATIANQVWDTDATGRQSAGSFGQAIGDPGANAETMYDAVITDAAGTNVAVDVVAVKAETVNILADTDDIGVAGAGLTDLGGMSDGMKTEVESEVNDGLVALGLDHLLGASVTGTDITDNSIIAKLVSKEATADWDDFVNTTDSLQAIRDRGDAEWITATGFSTHNAAAVWSVATRVLTANTNLNDISVSDILTTQMTEAYAANGVAPTLAQCMFAIHQFKMQHGISGTAWTVRKLDNTTTAFVVTLDDATNPTDAKRV